MTFPDPASVEGEKEAAAPVPGVLGPNTTDSGKADAGRRKAPPLGVGRTVHVRIASTQFGFPVLRPATVVQVHNDEEANMVVMLDGENDRERLESLGWIAKPEEGAVWAVPAMLWITNLKRGLGVGFWRWPERT